MCFETLFDQIGILPVICLKNDNELNTFLDALSKTPIKCIEITMRDPYSYHSIEYIKSNYPQYTVGAGTVMDTQTLDRVAALGADFCVSPGFDPETVSDATRKNIPFIPGCSTPSEILAAQKLGLDTVKLFPAEFLGGVAALRLYESAFRKMRFVPTGGITAENYLSYLACKNVLVCGGSFMIPKAMLASGDSDGIAKFINKYVSEYREMKK